MEEDLDQEQLLLQQYQDQVQTEHGPRARALRTRKDIDYNEDKAARARGPAVPHRAPPASISEADIERLLTESRTRPVFWRVAVMESVVAHVYEALPWLPIQLDLPMSRWLQTMPGRTLMAALGQRLSQPVQLSEAAGDDSRFISINVASEAELSEAVAAASAEPGSAAPPQCYGRGLTPDETGMALFIANSYECKRDDGNIAPMDYVIDELVGTQVMLAEVLYNMATARPLGPFATNVPERGKAPDLARQVPAPARQVLETQFHGGMSMSNAGRLRNQRLVDLVVFLLNINVDESLVHRSLRYAAQVTRAREHLMDNLVDLIDGVLCDIEPAADSGAAMPRAEEEDDEEEKEDAASVPLHPGPAPPRPDSIPPPRELERCWRVRWARAGHGTSARLATRGQEEVEVMEIKRGDIISIPHESSDDGSSYRWMGRVDQILQGARGRIMLKLSWLYHFLDQAQLEKGLVSGVRLSRTQDVLKQFRANPVLSRIYFQGTKSDLYGLWRFQPVLDSVMVGRELGPEDPAPQEIEDWKPWQVPIRRLTPSMLEASRGIPKAVVREIRAQVALGKKLAAKQKTKGAQALQRMKEDGAALLRPVTPETQIIMGTFQRERFQTFAFEASEQPPGPRKGSVVELSVLEPCCGCGGLSKMAGEYVYENGVTVKIAVKWGVDIDAGACQSFALNHPGAVAYNMRIDEFMCLGQHMELLARDLFKEGGKSFPWANPSDTDDESDASGDEGGAAAAAAAKARRRAAARKARSTDEEDASEGSGEEGSEEEEEGSEAEASDSDSAEEEEEEEEADGDDGEASEEETSEAGSVDEEEEEEEEEEAFVLSARISALRLWKRGTGSSHPYEPDRMSHDAPPPPGAKETTFDLEEIQRELEAEIRLSDRDGGAYSYRPQAFSASLLEVDVITEDGEERRGVRLDSAEKIDEYRALLEQFIREEKVPRRSSVGLIASGPPCQALTGLSWAHKKDSASLTMRSHKNNVLLQVARAIEYFRPEYCLVENVVGSLTTYESIYQLVARSNLVVLGYQYRTCLLSSARYMDPQDRRRVIVLAARPDMQLPPVPRPFNRDPLTRHFRCLQTGSSETDRGNLLVTESDLHPSDLDRPPAVIGDIIGPEQDLALAGGDAADAYASAPKTPIQLALRLTEDPGRDRLRQVAALRGFFSADVPNLSQTWYNPKDNTISRKKLEKQNLKKRKLGGGKSKKVIHVPEGKRAPADYSVPYPTLYGCEPSDLEAFAATRKGSELLAQLKSAEARLHASSKHWKKAHNGLHVLASTNNHVASRLVRLDKIKGRLLQHGTPAELAARAGRFLAMRGSRVGRDSLAEESVGCVRSASRSIVLEVIHPEACSPAVVFHFTEDCLHPILTPEDPIGRRCSLRELARIQTFSDSMCLAGVGRNQNARWACIAHQIANAVPCHLAMALGACVARGAARAHPPGEELARVTTDHQVLRTALEMSAARGLKPYVEQVFEGQRWKPMYNPKWSLVEKAVREEWGRKEGAGWGQRAELGRIEEEKKGQGQGQGQGQGAGENAQHPNKEPGPAAAVAWADAAKAKAKGRVSAAPAVAAAAPPPSGGKKRKPRA